MYRFKIHRTVPGLEIHAISHAARWYSLITTEHLPLLNRQVQRSADLVCLVGRWLLAGLMGPVSVVMAGVLAED